jgi:hypothetical protein
MKPLAPVTMTMKQKQHAAVAPAAPCTTSIIAKTRADLVACSKTMLRSESAAHKVHNASRKPKEQVIDELWQHYASCHSKDLPANFASTLWPTQVPARTTIAQVEEVPAAVAAGWVCTKVPEEASSSALTPVSESTQSWEANEGVKLCVHGTNESTFSELHEELFWECGNVLDVEYLKKNKNFVFVTMSDEDAAKSAIDTLHNYKDDHGHTLKVNCYSL